MDTKSIFRFGEPGTGQVNRLGKKGLIEREERHGSPEMVKSGLPLEEGQNDQVKALGNDENIELDMTEGILEAIKSVY